MSLKKAAEDLLKLADDLEAQAGEVTMFVCDKCNHTASLAKINGTRKAIAKEAGENVSVTPIGIEDTLSCPACEGVMAYQETAESKGFYFDDKKADDETPETDSPEHEEGETPAKEKKEHAEAEPKKNKKEAAIDYDQLDRYMRG